MTKIKELLKKSSRFFLGLAIGLTLSVGIGYAATVAGSSTTYNKSTSGLSSTNVQAAIDELYVKAKNSKVNSNIVNAYKYDETKTFGSGYSLTNNPSYCVTGEESTCKTTTCYKTKSAGSCAQGTIIDYKVNSDTTVRFHVIHDDGTTMRLQSQKDTTGGSWNSNENNTYGPTNILKNLEQATSTWTNVEDQNYSIGDNNTTLGYSGCYESKSPIRPICDKATYSLTRGPVKARMITAQEAYKVGCTGNSESCPNFMYKYLSNNYWTMTADSSNTDSIWHVSNWGKLDSTTYGGEISWYFGTRALVVINK